VTSSWFFLSTLRFSDIEGVWWPDDGLCFGLPSLVDKIKQEIWACLIGFQILRAVGGQMMVFVGVLPGFSCVVSRESTAVVFRVTLCFRIILN
jgi:hypothetical protein